MVIHKPDGPPSGRPQPLKASLDVQAAPGEVATRGARSHDLGDLKAAEKEQTNQTVTEPSAALKGMSVRIPPRPIGRSWVHPPPPPDPKPKVSRILGAPRGF